MRFASIRHAAQYLCGSIVVIDGVLYHIGSTPMLGCFEMNEVGTRKKFVTSVQWTWPGLHDAWCPPIGMTNVKNSGAVYLYRVPKRQWVVGLTSNNTNMVNHGTCPVVKTAILKSKAFADSVKGKYPSFNIAHNRVMDGEPGTSVAFSRQFALKNEGEWGITLRYKHMREHVAQFDNNMEPRWAPTFEYLQEQLDEVRDDKHLRYL